MKITGIAACVHEGLLKNEAFSHSQRVTDRCQTSLCAKLRDIVKSMKLV